MAQKTVIEQHQDCLDKVYIYVYSPIPFVQKGPDLKLGLEVKGLGHHGIVFCTPSIHKNGSPYQIMGISAPATLNIQQATELMQHLDQICIKYGVEYLERTKGIDSRLKGMVKNFVIDPNVRIARSTLLSPVTFLIMAPISLKDMWTSCAISRIDLPCL